MDNRKDEIAIHFQKGDVQIMIDALSLMGATLMMSPGGKAARDRLKDLLEQFERLSPLPGYNGSYGDSARFMQACSALKTCRQWEVVLEHERGSVFNDVRIAIETVGAGAKDVFNLTSELAMGLNAGDRDAAETYAVYVTRLVEMCQELAPMNAVQIATEKMRVAVSSRGWTYDAAKDAERVERLVCEHTDRAFQIRGLKVVSPMKDDGLPRGTWYVELVVAAPLGEHPVIARALAEITEESLQRTTAPKA